MDSNILLQDSFNSKTETLIHKTKRKGSSSIISMNTTVEYTEEDMKTEFLIKGLDLNFIKGGLNVVAGKIGSGKTSILDCLFGEMIPHLDTASLVMDERVEYVE